ncbi:cell division protein FtsQ/DivIB [Synechococcus sp. W2B2]|uniref:cell division protein FtsQ/DivIB n=1 Tax=unclassified Synechococcus TaxID=2626047 RepID=UPI00006BD70C|nr:FtsQ-type POTRA domain-containing protein [Synechococcus sp. WH 7805]EAR18264.1 hypothetical protein WH7805_05711 [Synechococcus sp. WH 7805]
MASIQTPSTPSPTPNPSAPLPPNIERRRRLRQEKLRERIIQAWRILFFAGSTTALAWILLSSGWNLRSIDQIRVSGSDRVGAESVVEAGDLRFPIPLLSLQPGNLERLLMDELPVQSVSIHRRLLPPGLEIKLMDRRPIAAATRNAAGGIERGMVDREGFWMPMTAALAEETPESDVRVQGWTLTRRATIAKLLEKRDQLGSPLQVVLVAPDGDLSVRMASLGLVKLGSNAALLDQQINTVIELTRSLPPQLRGQNNSTIDLSDPSKPELQLPPPPPKKASKS